MLLPVVLLFFATFSAAVMAYGTHSMWAQYSGGYEFILFARRIQWPMAVLSLILCLAVVGLVIAGKRRAWWLIGLAPVLMLFVHRFASDPAGQYLVLENPTFATAAEATFVGDDDWVVGVRFVDKDYAYPYAALFDTPVVIQAEHDDRMMLVWSAYANRAVALRVGRDLRGPDLQVVSTPANALLVYNTRLGQFINGVTGLTPAGRRPDGVREDAAIPVEKTTWKAWRAKHPQTAVLAAAGPRYATAPRGAIRPTMRMPKPAGDSSAAAGLTPEARVVVVGVKQPVAILSEQVTADPLNLSADGVPVLVFRDPADGTIRACDRRVDTDLHPTFRKAADRRRPKALFVDGDANAGWDARGVAIDGPEGIKGKRLAPVPVEDGLYWGVMKTWYPDLELAAPPK